MRKIHAGLQLKQDMFLTTCRCFTEKTGLVFQLIWSTVHLDFNNSLGVIYIM